MQEYLLRLVEAGLEAAHAHALPVVVLLEVAAEAARQGQQLHAVVGGVRDEHGARQLLEREGRGAGQRRGEHGLEEHDAGGVFVVLDESGDGARREHGRVVRVEAEPVSVVLNARVQRAPVLAERHREQVLLLRGVTQQERALWFIL